VGGAGGKCLSSPYREKAIAALATNKTMPKMRIQREPSHADKADKTAAQMNASGQGQNTIMPKTKERTAIINAAAAIIDLFLVVIVSPFPQLDKTYFLNFGNKVSGDSYQEMSVRF
jgi:hypothetical protein